MKRRSRPGSAGAGASRDRPLTAIDAGICAAVVALAVAMAANALGGAFVLDDLPKIVHNADIRSLANLPEKLLYPYAAHRSAGRNDPSRPLAFLAYTLIYAVAKLQPTLYHLFSAVVHGLAACGAYLIALRVRSRIDGTADRRLALTLAAFFVVTPIQMGSAIYIYALNDLLSTALLFGSVWLFIRADTPSPASRYWSLACMALALTAKQTAIVVPALLVLYDWVVVCEFRWSPLRGRWRYYVPYVALVVAYVAFRLVYFGGVGDLEAQSGALIPRLTYALIEPWVLWQYILKTFIPRGLAIDHAVLPPDVASGARALSLALWIVAIALLLVRSLRRRDAAARWMVLGVGWYLICLAPTSTIMPTVDLMAERRVYAANLGLFLFAAWGIDRIAARATPRWIVPGLLGAALAVFGAVSIARNAVQSDPERMWRSVLAMYPDGSRALNNLSIILSHKGELAEAQQLCGRVLASDSTDYVALAQCGYLMQRDENPARDVATALSLFQRSARINPDIAETHYNIGQLLQRQDRLDEAIAQYDTTLALDSLYAAALNNLAGIRFERGQIDEARRLVRRAFAIDSTDPATRDNLEFLERDAR